MNRRSRSGRATDGSPDDAGNQRNRRSRPQLDDWPLVVSTISGPRVAQGVAGEFSPFEELHGFSIDGADLDTAVLPDGWRDRLVKVQNANTAAPTGEPRFTGWCLDKEDLCVAKLIALREKDRNFVIALLDAGLVNLDLIAERLSTFSGEHPAATERALARLSATR